MNLHLHGRHSLPLPSLTDSIFEVASTLLLVEHEEGRIHQLTCCSSSPQGVGTIFYEVRFKLSKKESSPLQKDPNNCVRYSKPLTTVMVFSEMDVSKEKMNKRNGSERIDKRDWSRVETIRQVRREVNGQESPIIHEVSKVAKSRSRVLQFSPTTATLANCESYGFLPLIRKRSFFMHILNH